MPDDEITDFERESLRIYMLSEDTTPTPLFAFQFYIPHLKNWAFILLPLLVAIAWIPPGGPTLSLKATLIAIVLILFAGIVAWHVRLAYTAVSHWKLLRRILDWDTIHRLCELHDSKNAG